MFSAVILLTSLAFYGAQSFYKSTTSLVPQAAQTFYFCEILVFGQVGSVDFLISCKGERFVDADSLAEGCDEREEGNLEHNL